MFMSLQIKSSTLGLYSSCNTSYIFFINLLKSPVGALYKLNILNLDDLVASSVAQFPNPFLYSYVKY